MQCLATLCFECGVIQSYMTNTRNVINKNHWVHVYLDHPELDHFHRWKRNKNKILNYQASTESKAGQRAAIVTHFLLLNLSCDLGDLGRGSACMHSVCDMDFVSRILPRLYTFVTPEWQLTDGGYIITTVCVFTYYCSTAGGYVCSRNISTCYWLTTLELNQPDEQLL